jgi:hypothetical protein
MRIRLSFDVTVAHDTILPVPQGTVSPVNSLPASEYADPVQVRVPDLRSRRAPLRLSAECGAPFGAIGIGAQECDGGVDR